MKLLKTIFLAITILLCQQSNAQLPFPQTGGTIHISDSDREVETSEDIYVEHNQDERQSLNQCQYIKVYRYFIRNVHTNEVTHIITKNIHWDTFRIHEPGKYHVYIALSCGYAGMIQLTNPVTVIVWDEHCEEDNTCIQ